MIRKTIIFVLTLSTVGAFALILDARRTHFRSDMPAWAVDLGTRTLIVDRTVVRAIVPPRSTWGDMPGRVGIALFSTEYLFNSGGAWPAKQTFVGFELRLGAPIWSLELPLWYLVVVLGAYPVIALIQGPLRRRRRRKHGLCVTCAYDLQGNESGVCSECGTKC